MTSTGGFGSGSAGTTGYGAVSSGAFGYDANGDAMSGLGRTLDTAAPRRCRR